MSDNDLYALCLTCGPLKHEDLFHEGDCTCRDCYEADRHSVNYRENPDGDGYIRPDNPRNSRSVDTGKDRSATTNESDGGDR